MKNILNKVYYPEKPLLIEEASILFERLVEEGNF